MLFFLTFRLILCAAFVNMFISSVKCSKQCPEEELCSWLIDKCPYLNSPRGRPVVDQRHAVKIAIEFFLIRIVEVNDLSQTFTFEGSMVTSWFSACAKWDEPGAFNNSSLTEQARYVEECIFHKDKIWHPRLGISNSLGGIGNLEGFMDNDVPVGKSGLAATVITTTFQTHCSLKFEAYPFDIQRCYIQIFSASLWNDELDIVAYNVSYLSDAANNGSSAETLDGISQMWHVLDYYSVAPLQGLDLIRVYVVLERQYSYFYVSIFIPLNLLLILHVVAMVLPPDTFDRSAFMVYVIIALVTTLPNILGNIPKTSQRVYLFYYVASQLGLSVAIATYSILALVLSDTNWFSKTIKMWGKAKIRRGRMADAAAGSIAGFLLIVINWSYFYCATTSRLQYDNVEDINANSNPQ